MEITIEVLSGPTQEARELIAELDQVLGALYEPHQRHGLTIEQVFEPNVRFFVARLDDRAVGCGARARRGEGPSSPHREGSARRGEANAAARNRDPPGGRDRLYERCGFRRCGAFGHYAGLPPHMIAASLFYAKPL